MPTGIRPRVNEAREFLEIAKDFKDPKEIIREALSNSWDAGANKVSISFDLHRISGTRRNGIFVLIRDDGEGMSDVRKDGIETSEIEDFFNLGDSHKAYGSIGTKGHGTKVYYKSSSIIVDTWKAGSRIRAETEIPPWESLKAGIVPTYKYEKDTKEGRGTTILVTGFEGKQSEFASVETLIKYVLWYTVIGSFGRYFGHPRRMDLELKAINMPSTISIPFGFSFPSEQCDLSQSSDSYCKLFGPEKIECGQTKDGKNVVVEIVGAVLGESHRSLVPNTYEMMGVWLAKDFIRVERQNSLIEEVFGGQYYYRSMLIFANCQQFDLTANRNNIRNDQEEYDLAIAGIKTFLEKVERSAETKAYFERKKQEENDQKEKREKEDESARKERLKSELESRLNEYKGRPDLNATGVSYPPVKEPKSEAETALLLQAMISSRHPGIDFRIGEYRTSHGTDLLVEYTTKGIHSFAWAELVSSLQNLFAWEHPPEGIHKVICWQLGQVKEVEKFQGGREAKLVKAEHGRYHLYIGRDTLDVYVLRELL